jgi:hypothetical protein
VSGLWFATNRNFSLALCTGVPTAEHVMDELSAHQLLELISFAYLFAPAQQSQLIHCWLLFAQTAELNQLDIQQPGFAAP